MAGIVPCTAVTNFATDAGLVWQTTYTHHTPSCPSARVIRHGSEETDDKLYEDDKKAGSFRQE